MARLIGLVIDNEIEVENLAGHYAGPVTRLLALVADNFLSLTLYGLLLTFVTFLWNLILNGEVQAPDQASIVWAVGLVVWLYAYYAGTLVFWWKTPGMLLAGLRVVNREGSDLDPRRACVRVLAYPVSMVLAPVTAYGVVAGRERRAPHDALAGTVVVYDWNARDARWRVLARERSKRRLPAPTHPDAQLARTPPR